MGKKYEARVAVYYTLTFEDNGNGSLKDQAMEEFIMGNSEEQDIDITDIEAVSS